MNKHEWRRERRKLRKRRGRTVERKTSEQNEGRRREISDEVEKQELREGRSMRTAEEVEMLE